MLEDLRYAWGAMRRGPLLALASIVTLMLGIGLNAGVFTILDGLLFRPRVEKDPASFVHLSPAYRGAAAGPDAPWWLSSRDYRAFASQSRTLRSLAAWAVVRLSLEPQPGDPVLGLMTTPGFFDVYGLDRPLMGRTFAEGAAEAVISEELWRSRFGSDPRILGRLVRANHIALTVVGVTPAGFSGRIRGPGFWVPWSLQPALAPPANWLGDDGPRWLTVEGRLAAGRTRKEARSELQVIAARLDRLEPGRKTAMQLTNGSFGEEPAMRAGLFWIGPLIMAGLTLILLIACTNVAILQLSRAVARQREMAIRLAIGAGRWRLTRMLLTETLLLAAIAGTASSAVAYQAPRVFLRIFGSAGMPVYPLRPDSAVLAYLGVVVLLTACFAGMTPAAESLRVNLSESMKMGEGWHGGPSHRGHGFLVAAQVAMSVVLLVTAGLFARGQWRAFTADPGFDAGRVILVQAHGNAELAAALRSVPGVQVVAAGSPLPGDESLGELTAIEVPRASESERKSAVVTSASPEFFPALGIPIVRGQVFRGGGDAVVSEDLARSFWPGEDPLGRRLVLPDGANVRVAGVARDLRAEHAGVTDAPHVYRYADVRTAPEVLLARFAGSASAVESGVREAMQRVAGDEFGSPRTLRAILDENAARMGAIVRMVGVLALTALLLAVLGIYGVVALGARRRTRELGIRMALGATRRRLVNAVLSSGLRPIFWGVGTGAVLAVAAARATAVVLKRAPIPIAAGDPLVYVAVAALLAAVGVAAMLAPAAQAAGVDPMQALRHD
jgi:predicted permease